ncbi:protein rolling stone-like, partial [Dendronephthya gigantea]|uniref:protein rolling stone-like n=1 Tax=Dendronephthya gigantea TaxID=151771 RepID=UPI001069D7EF
CRQYDTISYYGVVLNVDRLVGDVRQELAVKRLSLRLDDANVLTASAVLPFSAFLVLRLVITLFLFACIIWSGFDDRVDDAKWFIYLTNLSFAMLNIAFIMLSALSLSKAYRMHQNKPQTEAYGTFETSVEAARRQEQIELPSEGQQIRMNIQSPALCKWYHQVIWLIYNVAFCAAIIVSIGYWLFQAKHVQFLDVVTHAFNTIFVLIEHLLGRVPIRLFHAVYTIIYLSLYVIFSVIYWQAGGLNARGKTYIYKIFDYDNKNAGVITAFVLLLAVIGPIVIQLILLGLCKLRGHWFSCKSEA